MVLGVLEESKQQNPQGQAEALKQSKKFDDDQFSRRHQRYLPFEMKAVALSTERSRTHFGIDEPQTWYDFRLFPAEYDYFILKSEKHRKIEKGIIYYEEKNGKLAYSYRTPNGTVINRTSNFTMDQFNVFREEILNNISRNFNEFLSDDKVAANTVYFTEDEQGTIKCTFKIGQKVFRDEPVELDDISFSNPLTIEQLIPYKQKILKMIKEKHQDFNDYPQQSYYASIPVVAHTLMKEEADGPETKETSPDSFEICNIPDGFIGLIDNEGKKEIIPPGKHKLRVGKQCLEDFKDVTTDYFKHGTTHVVNVPNRGLSCVEIGSSGRFYFLLPGRHVFKSPDVTRVVPVIDPYGLDVKIRKTENEIALEREYLRATQKKGEEPKEVELYRQLFARVPEGKFAVCYDAESQLVILGPGVYYIPPTWKFFNRISSKEDILEDIKLVAGVDSGVNMDVIANVGFQIIDPHAAISLSGPNKIQPNIKSSAIAAVKSTLMHSTAYPKDHSLMFVQQQSAKDVLRGRQDEAKDEAQGPVPPSVFDEEQHGASVVRMLNDQSSQVFLGAHIKATHVTLKKVSPVNPGIAQAIDVATKTTVELHNAAIKQKTEIQQQREAQQARHTLAMERMANESKELKSQQTLDSERAALEIARALEAVKVAQALAGNSQALEVYKTQCKIDAKRKYKYPFFKPKTDGSETVAGEVNLHVVGGDGRANVSSSSSTSSSSVSTMNNGSRK